MSERHSRWFLIPVTGLAIVIAAAPATAQTETRASTIEQAQTQKAGELKPYEPGTAERYLDRAEQILTTGLNLHPFFQSAYSGGGFTLGAGYRRFVSAYNTVDVRGSL